MSPSPILKKFVAISTQTPDLWAIASENKNVTYGQLINLASSLAHELQLQIKVPGQCVAIIGEREIETPLAMIACLLAGVPFVVIDEAYPDNRIASICKIAGATAILHRKSNQSIQSKTFQHLLDIKKFIQIDKDRPIKSNLPTPYECETAYLLFTSGTTGFPKGIKIGHLPLPHFIEWYKQKFNPIKGARFSMLSGLSHDPILRDIFVPLSIGGTLCIPVQEKLLDKDYLYSWMKESKIHYAHMTPQMISVLLSVEQKNYPLTDLRYVFSGGDVLRPFIYSSLKKVAVNANLVNFYGTSETPQAVAYQVIEHDLQTPYPIGREINDVIIEILDNNLNPVETSVRGEIAIKTKFLSLGYINENPNMSNSTILNSFIHHHVHNGDGERRFLTGDIGFKDSQGNIHFCGRKDDQVKIRGFRVDCAEVAASIERFGLAKQAVVIPDSGNNEDTYLIAFTTSESKKVEEGLRNTLPPYMVPSLILHVSTIPLLANGKVDRTALKAIGQQHKTDRANNNNNFDNEFLVKIARVFENSDFNPKLSFVEMGGDSLSYINISFLIEKHIGYLPKSWEYIPLIDLSLIETHFTKTDKKSFSEIVFLKVPHTILLRAIGINFVVLGHAGIFLGSGTSTLFVISGISIARFQLLNVINNRTLIPIFQFIAKYGIPAGLWQLLRCIFVKEYLWFPDLVLSGTFWQNPNGGHYTFWFLDVLTASILIFCILALVISSSKYAAKTIFKKIEPYFLVSLIVLLFGVVAYFIQTETNLWNGEVGNTSVGPFRWFWMIPFGSAIHFAKSREQKTLVSFIGVLIVLIFTLIRPDNLSSYSTFTFDYFFIVSVLILIWLEQLYIPKFLNKTITIIAANSLFIYIVNHAVITILMPKLTYSLGFPAWPLGNVLAAITLGVLTGVFWNRISPIANRVIKSFKMNLIKVVF